MFDSKEEEYFSFWVEELIEKGYIEDYKLQYPSYELIPAKSIDLGRTGKRDILRRDCPLLQSLTYTPDFYIVWNEKALNKLIFTSDYISPDDKVSALNLLKSKLYAQEIEGKLVSVIDIKPSYDFHKNTMSIKFPILQKVLYHNKGIYVQRVRPLAPNDIFANTFTPKKIHFTKRKKPRKFKFKVKELNKFIDDEK